MLTEKLTQKIDDLLSVVKAPKGNLNVIELQGFLYAVIITPEIIQPNEWMPAIFNGELPEFNVTTQMLMDHIIEAYNHYNTLLLEDDLRFPYDPEKVTTDENEYEAILEWTWGFLMGLQLRADFWTQGVAARKSTINPEADSIHNSFKIIQFLTNDCFDDEDFIRQLKQDMPDEVSEEEFEDYSMSLCILLLPNAVENIQSFAAKTLEQIEVENDHSSTPGRDDPCLCGSGKTFGKCCLH